MKKYLVFLHDYFVKHPFILIIIICLISSCEEENPQPDSTEFLSQKSVTVTILNGEWIWLNTHGGITGSSMITPATEGYFRSLVFTSQQNYIEITDNHVTLQTYYKIDSTKQDHYGTPIFKITYFDKSKISQNMLTQQENDTTYLYLYDNTNCRDCLSTSVYRKIK